MERPDATVVTSAAEARRLGRYVLVGEIAEGGMGRIYLARQMGAAGFEKLMAVKVMHPHLAEQHPELAEMFMDEARIASRISHPNVCGVFDYGEAHGVRYIVMEYLSGQPILEIFRTLHARPGEREHPLFYALVARLIAEACEGLHGAHFAVDPKGQPLNIVHRDVSPENVFVTYAGAVKVMDFGIARARGKAHQTQAGTFKGKLAYAPPEAYGDGPVDARADIWSLGVVLWEFLTDRSLFLRQTEAQILGAIFHDDIPPPSRIQRSVPPELDAVALRALSRNPEGRYEKTRDMARDLNKFAVAMGEHVGSGEIGDWLKQLFPEAYKKALETDRQVRLLVPDLSRAPSVSDGGGKKALISVVRKTPIHEEYGDVDEDAATAVADISNLPVAEEADFLDDDTDAPVILASQEQLRAGEPVWPEQGGGEAVWPEQGDGQAVWPEQASGPGVDGSGGHEVAGQRQISTDQEVWQTPPKKKEKTKPITTVLRIVVGIVLVGGAIWGLDWLTTEPEPPPVPPDATAQAGAGAGESGTSEEEPEPELEPTVEEGDEGGDGVTVLGSTGGAARGDEELGDDEPQDPDLAGEEEARRAEERAAERAERRAEGRQSRMTRMRGSRSMMMRTTGMATAGGDPGVVNVFAVGGWADIYEGSRRLGRTPARLSLPAGRHVLSIRPPNGPAQRRVVNVPAGGSIRLAINL